MPQNNYYFGFSTFEEFLAASPTKSIYLTQSVSDTPGEMGVIYRTWHVTAAAMVEGVCHYWRMKIGSDQVFGEPFPEQIKYAYEVQERGASLQRELSSIARENDYSVVCALVSIPKDVVVMTGRVTSLKYDKESNSFRRVPPPDAENAPQLEGKIAA